MKTIRTYTNVAEAGFAASLLEAAGIKALLNGEESFLMTPGLATGGIRLQVEAEDVERALQLLNEGFDGDLSDSKRSSTEAAGDRSPDTGRVPVGLFVAGLAALALLWFAIQQWRENEARHAPPREEAFTADFNGDGKDDRFYTYRNGFLVHGEADRNFDGKIDSWTRCDSQGREETFELDENFDGRPDYWASYLMGTVQRWKRDTDFDGKPDYFGTCENGGTVVAEYRPGDATVVTRRQFWANELVYEEQVDEDVDGTMDYRIVFDAFGAPSSHLNIKDGK